MRVSTVRKSQRSLVTERPLRLATRDHKNTQPLDRRLDGAALSSGAKGSVDCPQGKNAVAIEANRSKAERVNQERREV